MSTRAARAESLARWDREHDVVLAGHGGAGDLGAELRQSFVAGRGRSIVGRSPTEEEPR